MVKITIITPSVRPEMLPMVDKCIKRQTFKDYEWLVSSPKDYGFGTWVQEPDKREGDYYGLNKAWNAAFKQAKGELIVIICDGQWFQPDLLERLWNHYEDDPESVVGAIGHQYDQIENGKPEHMVWRDPRARTDMGSFYETPSTEIEWCVASFPKKAIFEVGGMDEKYDQGAALSEKEANLRMEKAGYKCYLDQTIEYRAIHHERLSKQWDDKYKIATEMYLEDARNILDGKRTKVDFI